MSKNTSDFDLLFETSWEVCNKVGGIYTVLSTKAKTLQDLYKDRTVFVGPDVWSAETPSPYFIESTPAVLRRWSAQLMLPEGVTVRCGRWDIPGKPMVVLVGFKGFEARNDELFGRMWQLYGVDSLHAYGDYGEGCAFAHAAGVVIADMARYFGIDEGKKMIAHFDEWTTGMGLLYVKHEVPQIATIFTTHATCIGRSICGNNKPLYDYLHAYDGDQMARELNMEAKHSLEKTAAREADCFTTVSEITARECEQLLGRRPDVVTPNGFEQNFVPAKSRYAKARRDARQRMLDVASALTGNIYNDADTFIVVTSGRCEYHNKGIDLYLDAMDRLSSMDIDKKILAFVMVPAWMKEPRADLMKALDDGGYSRQADPVITHWLHNGDSDPIICRIHGIGFDNDTYSRVSVVYVPSYLNGADGIFDLTYYQLLPGVDVTVFASYYEPWGYTPLESVAFGVPTVTTSLSGFGQWVMGNYANDFAACGVKVEPRGDFNYHEVKEAIAADIASLAKAPAPLTAEIHGAAMRTAAQAAWSLFVEYYNEAFAIALANAAARQ